MSLETAALVWLCGLMALALAVLRVPVGVAIAGAAGGAVAALGGDAAWVHHLQSGLWQDLEQHRVLAWACLALGVGVGFGRRSAGVFTRAWAELQRRALRSAEWAGALFLLLLAAETALEAGRWLSLRA